MGAKSFLGLRRLSNIARVKRHRPGKSFLRVIHRTIRRPRLSVHRQGVGKIVRVRNAVNEGGLIRTFTVFGRLFSLVRGLLYHRLHRDEQDTGDVRGVNYVVVLANARQRYRGQSARGLLSIRDMKFVRFRNTGVVWGVFFPRGSSSKWSRQGVTGHVPSCRANF